MGEKKEIGRPKLEADKVRSHEVKVRMSDSDLESLNELSKWAKMNRSETIRSLIKEAKNYYISPDPKNT